MGVAKILIRSKSLLNIGVLTVGLTLFFYLSLGPNLWNLNNVQFDQSGDGLKNYYTFAYHYQYSNGFTFEGFLYPYGDLALYADSQVALVWLLQLLRDTGIDLSHYLLGILNGLPLLSFLIGGLFIILILKTYDVTDKYIGITALLCIAMSPQVWRVQSHFALAYACIIPIAWYLYLRLFIANSSLSRLCLILISILFLYFVAFLHPYHLVVVSLFLFLLAIVSIRRSRSLSICLFVIVIISLLAFFLTTIILDSSHDRPKNPYGLWAYKTEIIDLLPFFGFIGHLLGKFVSLRSTYTEGYCYLSFLPFLLFFVICGHKLCGGKRSVRAMFGSLPNNLKDPFLAGFMTLLFAMGVHLMLTGEMLLNIVPQLKQFRGLGRFSWPFYYVASIYFAVLFWNLVQSKTKNSRTSLLAFLVILAWIFESYSYHQTFSKSIQTYESENLLREQTDIAKMLGQNVRTSEFQAILTLPPSTEGAEKISLFENYFVKTRTLPFSFQSGLPMTSCIMSRAPLSKVMNVLQLSSSKYSQKKLKSGDFQNSKPFLVVIANDYRNDYHDLLSDAELLAADDVISLYSLPLDQLVKRKRFMIPPNSRELSDKILHANNDSLLFFDDFTGYDNIGIALHNGAFFNEHGSAEIMNLVLKRHNTMSVELSFWNRMLDDKSSVPTFELKVYDKNGSIMQQDEFRDWDLRRVEVYDEWIRYKRTYTIEPSDAKIILTVTGDHQYIDKLLFKTKNIDVYQCTSSVEIYANHLFVDPVRMPAGCLME